MARGLAYQRVGKNLVEDGDHVFDCGRLRLRRVDTIDPPRCSAPVGACCLRNQQRKSGSSRAFRLAEPVERVCIRLLAAPAALPPPVQRIAVHASLRTRVRDRHACFY